tara:strand:- start:1579 stop:1800 length:222 start_codon:yes stop_codon:yes gene_type:complete
MVSYKETIIKTLIWRVIATGITVLVSWTVTGSLKFGLAVGSIDTILKTIGYFSYERAWILYNKPKQNTIYNKE